MTDIDKYTAGDIVALQHPREDADLVLIVHNENDIIGIDGDWGNSDVFPIFLDSGLTRPSIMPEEYWDDHTREGGIKYLCNISDVLRSIEQDYRDGEIQ